jgi:hypothetical protein
MTTILFLYTVLDGPVTVEVAHVRAATVQDARAMLSRHMLARNLRGATLQLQAVPDDGRPGIFASGPTYIYMPF